MFEFVIWAVRASLRRSDEWTVVASLTINSIAMVLTLVRIADSSSPSNATANWWTGIDVLALVSTIVATTETCQWPDSGSTEGLTGVRCEAFATGVVARTWFTFGFLKSLYARQAFAVAEQLVLGGKTLADIKAAQADLLDDDPAAATSLSEAAGSNTRKERAARRAVAIAQAGARPDGAPQTDRKLHLAPHRRDPCDKSQDSGLDTAHPRQTRSTTNKDSGLPSSSVDAPPQPSSNRRNPAYEHMIRQYGSGWDARAAQLVQSSAWAVVDLSLRGAAVIFVLACTFYVLELIGDPGPWWQAESGFWYMFQCDDGTVTGTPSPFCSSEVLAPFSAIYFVLVSMTTVGYGDFSPSGSVSRLFLIFVLILGLAAFANQTSQFLELVAQEKRQPKSIRRALGRGARFGHVLVIGDPSRTQVQAFLREFFHADHAPQCERPVVFLLHRPSPDVRELLEDPQPSWSARTILLDGSPARDADLYRAAAEKASAIVVLPRRGRAGGRGEDRSNLLRVLRIKRYIAQISAHERADSGPRSCLTGALACLVSTCQRCGGTGTSDGLDDPLEEDAASTASGAGRPTRVVQAMPRFLVAVQAAESRKFAAACGLHEVVARDSLDYSLLGQSTVTPAVSTLISNLVRSSDSGLLHQDQAWSVEFKTGAECEVYTVGVDARLAGLTVGRVGLALARRTDGAVHVLGCTVADARYLGHTQLMERAVAAVVGETDDGGAPAERARTAFGERPGARSRAQASRAANVAALNSTAGMVHSRLLLGLPSVVLAAGCRLVVLTDSLVTAKSSVDSISDVLEDEAKWVRHERAALRERARAARAASQRPAGADLAAAAAGAASPAGSGAGAGGGGAAAAAVSPEGGPASRDSSPEAGRGAQFAGPPISLVGSADGASGFAARRPAPGLSRAESTSAVVRRHRDASSDAELGLASGGEQPCPARALSEGRADDVDSDSSCSDLSAPSMALLDGEAIGDEALVLGGVVSAAGPGDAASDGSQCSNASLERFVAGVSMDPLECMEHLNIRPSSSVAAASVPAGDHGARHAGAGGVLGDLPDEDGSDRDDEQGSGDGGQGDDDDDDDAGFGSAGDRDSRQGSLGMGAGTDEEGDADGADSPAAGSAPAAAARAAGQSGEALAGKVAPPAIPSATVARPGAGAGAVPGSGTGGRARSTSTSADVAAAAAAAAAAGAVGATPTVNPAAAAAGISPSGAAVAARNAAAAGAAAASPQPEMSRSQTQPLRGKNASRPPSSGGRDASTAAPGLPTSRRRDDKVMRNLIMDLTRYRLTANPATNERELEPPAQLLGRGGHVVVLCPPSVDWLQLIHVLRPLRRSRRLPGIVILHPTRPSRREWARLQVRAAARNAAAASNHRRRVLGWRALPARGAGGGSAVLPRAIQQPKVEGAMSPASAAASAEAAASFERLAHDMANTVTRSTPVYLVVGSPEDSMDLGRAGVQTAARVLVLSGRSEAVPGGDPRSSARRSSSDQDIVHDALTVFTAQSIRSTLLQRSPPIVMELRQPLHLELVVAMTASVNAACHVARVADSKRRRRGGAGPAAQSPAAVVGARLPPRSLTLSKMSPLVRALATGDFQRRQAVLAQQAARSRGLLQEDSETSDDDEEDDEDEENAVFALPDMADGSVYASTMLEGLMAKSFFDITVMPIIYELVCGRGARFHLTGVPLDPSVVRSHIRRFRATPHSSLPAWLAESPTPDMALPHDPLRYGEMYEYLQSFGLLPVAIFRHGRLASGLGSANGRRQRTPGAPGAQTPGSGFGAGGGAKGHNAAGSSAFSGAADSSGMAFLTGLDMFRAEREEAEAGPEDLPMRPYVYSAPPLECTLSHDDCVFVLSQPALNASPLFAALTTIQRAFRVGLVFKRARERERANRRARSRLMQRRRSAGFGAATGIPAPPSRASRPPRA
ncbi:hypothetical protein FNF29_01302 [Cafeteria roenbergensis]|uniref:Potassium channel domain-containing protein n=1 Tax=Cafeteria roenbergensis TaxID=33653 RepID=A0A5A8CS00_CAFRO|nr:hypothetical protein FNF29_01302 [Cafeteria roenbergensis]|eukprot:KAA0155883.1 hypothetical protein FNF29_01302 [Cafeteria roenbergensis]